MGGPGQSWQPKVDWQEPLRLHRPWLGSRVRVSRWQVATHMMHLTFEVLK